VHVLFVHQSFPAQFGPFAFHLAARPGWRCTFVTKDRSEPIHGVECVPYQLKGGATKETHYCSRTFENAIWHSHAVFQALAARPDLKPDVIVGHSGFGSTLFLKELYPDVPIINLFEYFYHVTNSDMDFRPEFQPSEMDRLRARARNGMILLDLDNCTRGYSPTSWQRSRFPLEYQSKLHVVFDGIDTSIWKPQSGTLGQIGDHSIPAGTKILTYVARGFESMRGFDMFMKTAKLILAQRQDVVIIVVGTDRVHYGGDLKHTGGKTFKEFVLSQDDYDLSRIIFTGALPERALARLLALTDLHIYLTVPFVLSWSMLNAMACGAVVLGSDTAPVRELIEPGKTGLLADFHSPEAIAEAAEAVLRNPSEYKALGHRAAELIRESYSVEVCLPQFEQLLTQG
jgi:glycosyltransferase involved in cell wall biosynthesis